MCLCGIDRFLAETARYSTGIVARKQEELRDRLVACVRDLVGLQISNYQKKAIELLHRLCEINNSLAIAARLEHAHTEAWRFFSAGLEGTPGRPEEQRDSCCRRES